MLFKAQLRYQNDGYYLERCSGDLTEMLMFSLHDVLYMHHQVWLVQFVRQQLEEDHAEHQISDQLPV